MTRVEQEGGDPDPREMTPIRAAFADPSDTKNPIRIPGYHITIQMCVGRAIQNVVRSCATRILSNSMVISQDKKCVHGPRWEQQK